MRAQTARDPLDQPVRLHMRTDFVALRADHTIREALQALRGQTLGERVVYFYVLDRDNRLAGVLPTRRLLMGDDARRVGDVMQTRVVTLPENATLLLACELFVMHRLLGLPVVDGQGRMLGVLEASLFTDEVFDMSERREAHDLFQLIGVRLATRQAASPWDGFRRRFPWLMCNVAGGTACALLCGRYEAFLQSVIVLAMFVPVVLALAESVSMQSLTLSLAALHGGPPAWRPVWTATRREFLTAAMLGSGVGAIVGLVALVWRNAGMVAVAIGLTICLSVVTACLLGTLLPMAARALRIDPRVAAGPIVLACADLLTLLLYFTLSGRLLA